MGSGAGEHIRRENVVGGPSGEDNHCLTLGTPKY